MENELYHYRLKGDRNGYTRIKGYIPIGQKAKEVTEKVKTAATKLSTSIKDKVGSIISKLSSYKEESVSEGESAASAAISSIGDKKVVKKNQNGPTFDTSTGIDEPGEKPTASTKKEETKTEESKVETKEEPEEDDHDDQDIYDPSQPFIDKTPKIDEDESQAPFENGSLEKYYQDEGINLPIPAQEMREILKRSRMSHAETEDDYLMHYGIPKQKWGVRHGPPYPLDWDDKSAAQKKASPEDLKPSSPKRASEMTTQELKEATERMRAEDSYNEAIAKRTPVQKSKWTTTKEVADMASQGTNAMLSVYNKMTEAHKTVARRDGATTRPDYEHMTNAELAQEVAWFNNYEKVNKIDPQVTTQGKDAFREVMQTIGSITALVSGIASIAEGLDRIKKK